MARLDAALTFVALLCALPVLADVASPWSQQLPSNLYPTGWGAARGGNSAQGQETVVGFTSSGFNTVALGVPITTTAPSVLWQGATPFGTPGQTSWSSPVFAGGNLIGPTVLPGGAVGLQAFSATSSNFQPTWTSDRLFASSSAYNTDVYTVGSRPNLLVALQINMLGPSNISHTFAVLDAETGRTKGPVVTYVWQSNFNWLDADEDVIVGWTNVYNMSTSQSTMYRVGLTIGSDYSISVRFNVSAVSVAPTLGYISAATGSFVLAWAYSGTSVATLEGYDTKHGTKLWASNAVPGPFYVQNFAVIRELGYLVATNANSHVVALHMRSAAVAWETPSPDVNQKQICTAEAGSRPYVAVATTNAVWVFDGSNGDVVGDAVLLGQPTAIVCANSTTPSAHVAVIGQQGSYNYYIQAAFGSWQ